MTEGLVMTFWMLENLRLLYCDRIRVLSWGFVKGFGATVVVIGRRKVSDVVVRRRVISLLNHVLFSHLPTVANISQIKHF